MLAPFDRSSHPPTCSSASEDLVSFSSPSSASHSPAGTARQRAVKQRFPGGRVQGRVRPRVGGGQTTQERANVRLPLTALGLQLELSLLQLHLQQRSQPTVQIQQRVIHNGQRQPTALAVQVRPQLSAAGGAAAQRQQFPTAFHWRAELLHRTCTRCSASSASCSLLLVWFATTMMLSRFFSSRPEICRERAESRKETGALQGWT